MRDHTFAARIEFDRNNQFHKGRVIGYALFLKRSRHRQAADLTRKRNVAVFSGQYIWSLWIALPIEMGLDR